MNYIMEFEYTAVVIFFVVLFHYSRQRRMSTGINRIFVIYFVIGFLDVLLDLTSGWLLMSFDPAYKGLTEVLLDFYYVFQMIIPYIIFVYLQLLRDVKRSQRIRLLHILGIPVGLMTVLILSNPWTALFFQLSDSGKYIRGPLFMLMYFTAVFYMVCTVIGLIRHRKDLTSRKCAVMIQLLLFLILSVGVQIMIPQLLLTGFGIGLGILVMYLNINNPAEYTDSLTGAFNQFYFMEKTRALADRKKSFYIVFVYAYHLREVNKIYGTSTGNAALRLCVQHLQEICGSDNVFRMSGNRMCTLFNSREAYEKGLTSIRSFLEHPLQTADTAEFYFPCTLAGIPHAELWRRQDDLLAYIEFLLGRATRKEICETILSDERSREGYAFNKNVESYLHTALEEDLFEIYFQPIYSVSEKRFISLEALSRLKHPEYGYISPMIFITLAEKNGSISRLGRLQFNRICRYVSQHISLFDYINNIKINLSPAELLKEGYASELLQTMEQYHLKKEWFQFEITETVATEYTENLLGAIQSFTDAGIDLCLDDFGSGYSNLNAVLKLPFRVIKMDRSLLNGITKDPQVSMFYRSITWTLHEMGFLIVAEGAETQEEVEMLHHWKVDMIQGFYYARPMPGDEVIALLKEEKSQK